MNDPRTAATGSTDVGDVGNGEDGGASGEGFDALCRVRIRSSAPTTGSFETRLMKYAIDLLYSAGMNSNMRYARGGNGYCQTIKSDREQRDGQYSRSDSKRPRIWCGNARGIATVGGHTMYRKIA